MKRREFLRGLLATPVAVFDHRADKGAPPELAELRATV